MFYHSWDTSSNNKRKVYIPLLLYLCLCTTGQTGSDNRSDRLQENPANTGQTGPLIGQTDPTKSEGCNSALKCATRQLSNLGVSIHDFPPLCIPADKLYAAGAKIHVWVPWNKSMVATNPEQLILSKTYPTSGYNLAHVSRHARLLAGGYFAEKHCKWVLIFPSFSSHFYH